MKKIIYVCLLTLLAISFGCSKDEVFVEDESKNSESTELVNDLEKGKFNQETQTTAGQKNNVNTNYYDENGNEIETLDLYLDMDYIEANYNGLYSGSFSQHYYNEMSTHFTIHSVEYANSRCGNIERWVVTKPEYESYLISIGGNDDGVIQGTSDGPNNTSSSSGSGDSSTSAGWGDENGNPVKPKKKGDPDEPNTTTVPVEYQDCF